MHTCVCVNVSKRLATIWAPRLAAHCITSIDVKCCTVTSAAAFTHACMHAHVHGPPPAGQYFLMARQSIDGSSSVSKPHLLASLVTVASASARLHQRTTVLDCPDAALAVVLLEHSLANKVSCDRSPPSAACTTAHWFAVRCMSSVFASKTSCSHPCRCCRYCS